MTRYISNSRRNEDLVLRVSKAGVATDVLTVAAVDGSVRMLGRTDGVAVPAGYIGQVIAGTVITTENSTSGATQDVFYDVTSAHQITVPAGSWRIIASIGNIYTDATGAGYRTMYAAIRTTANVLFIEKVTSIIPPGPGFSVSGVHLEDVVDLGSTTTYKISYRYKGFSGSLAPGTIGVFGNASPTKLYAIRIA